MTKNEKYKQLRDEQFDRMHNILQNLRAVFDDPAFPTLPDKIEEYNNLLFSMIRCATQLAIYAPLPGKEDVE